MKFVRYRQNDAVEIGIFNAQETAVMNLKDVFLQKDLSTMHKVVENLTDKDIDKLHSWLQNERLFKTKVEDIKILAPIERSLHDILCVGVNYSAHLQETQDRVDGFKKETNEGPCSSMHHWFGWMKGGRERRKKRSISEDR